MRSGKMYKWYGFYLTGCYFLIQELCNLICTEHSIKRRTIHFLMLLQIRFVKVMQICIGNSFDNSKELLTWYFQPI